MMIRRALEVLSLVLLGATLALAVVLVARGSPQVHASLHVTPVAPQQAAAARVAMQAPVRPAVAQQDSLPCPPPPGEGVMGACVAKPVQVYGTRLGAKVVPATNDPPASIPDVSSWQGAVNWSAVKQWQLSHHFTPAGIFKMGEYVLDPYASRNDAQLRALGMWRAGYWYLRNTGCGREADQMIGEARTLNLRIVIEDDEAPETAGYDGCLTAKLRAAGLIAVEYSSPGAYPGGSRDSTRPTWIAAYGPLSPPASPWGGPIKAFQCTDGVFGCVTSIPGLGRGDVSIDYGITKLTASSTSLYPPAVFSLAGGVRASELNTTRTWDRERCRNPVIRPVCKSSRFHLVLLVNREWFVAHHKLVRGRWVAVGKARWGDAHLGARFQGIERRLNAR